jgi:elongator complex protein 2
MTCVVPLSPTRIITAGEEKLLRAFDMPLGVRRGLRKLCKIDVGCCDEASVVDRAYIPELGLSNRAVELMSKAEAAEQESRGVEVLDWAAPPLEGQLADHTIWPEVKKLFAHSNDVLCVASSAVWLASASKARDVATAAIVLWNIDKMTAVSKLQVHESSVVCLQFSGDGGYLASAGKDRSLCVFKRTGQARQPFEVHAEQPAAHKRIIWDCSWVPIASGAVEPSVQLLVTGSRDGVCKLWRVSVEADDKLACLLSFTPFGGSAVTALHCRPIFLDAACLTHTLAVGSEDGNISVWIMRVGNDGADASAEVAVTVSQHLAHGATVKRLRWNPRDETLLASGSADSTMRVYKVNI